jgi:hypothetical protein
LEAGAAGGYHQGAFAWPLTKAKTKLSGHAQKQKQNCLATHRNKKLLALFQDDDGTDVSIQRQALRAVIKEVQLPCDSTRGGEHG